MAIQTRRLVDYTDPRWGSCRYEFDYQDVPNSDGTLTVTALRCVNLSSRSSRARLSLIDGSRSTGWVYTDPGATDVRNLPTGQATRLGVTAVNTSHGVVLDGMDGEFQWPVDAP